MRYTTVSIHSQSLWLFIILVSFLTSRTTKNGVVDAFQVTPPSNSDGTNNNNVPPKLSVPPSTTTQGISMEGMPMDEQIALGLTTTTTTTSSSRMPSNKGSFQSTSAVVPTGNDYEEALDELLRHWSPPSLDSSSATSAIGCLFVSPSFASRLQPLVESAQRRLGEKTQFLTVVGGGVVGNGEEYEGNDVCGITFLGGILPKSSSVQFFSYSDNQEEETWSSFRSTTANDNFHDTTIETTNSSKNSNKRQPSHLIFADPHCHKIRSLLLHQEIDGIVAGGISVTTRPNQSSLAIGTKVMPPGSLVGITFSGNIGLQVVVTQGCQPVGDIFRVTNVKGPCINELNSERAIDKLQEIMKEVMEEDGVLNIPNIKSDDFLGGVHPNDDVNHMDGTTSNDGPYPYGFTLRQMTGFRPRSGSIIVCGPQIQIGDYFRFHIQSKSIALKDWQNTLQQAKTERLFLGETIVGNTFLGAFQISCMGRGKHLFGGVPNVDLRHIEQLLPPNTPISGFMANAEIGPVGIRLGGTSEVCQSVIHGFASVVAMLCDYTDYSSSSSSSSSAASSSAATGLLHYGRGHPTTTSCLGNSTEAGSWE